MSSYIAQNTHAPGIFQGDVVVRTAILEGLRDLKAHPEFLEFCYSYLVQDDLTKSVYGEAELKNAIEWVLKQDIPVIDALGFNEVKLPCITLELMEGTEQAATLGDTHYKVSEDYYHDWVKTASSLTPIARGLNTLTFANFGGGTVTKGMVLVTRTGQIVDILSVKDYVVTINPDYINYDYTQVDVYPKKPPQSVRLESIKLKESYRIGCHAQGEAVHLSYLFSLILFLLLRYKQSLFEHRGFDNMKVSYGPPHLHPSFEESHKVFTRYITITGYVSQHWPKSVYDKIQKVISQPSEANISLYPVNSEAESWKGSEDTNQDFEDFFNDPNSKRITYMVDGEGED